MDCQRFYSVSTAKSACLQSHKDSCIVAYITINVHTRQNTFKIIGLGKKIKTQNVSGDKSSWSTSPSSYHTRLYRNVNILV